MELENLLGKVRCYECGCVGAVEIFKTPDHFGIRCIECRHTRLEYEKTYKSFEQLVLEKWASKPDQMIQF